MFDEKIYVQESVIMMNASVCIPLQLVIRMNALFAQFEHGLHSVRKLSSKDKFNGLHSVVLESCLQYN